MAGYKMTSAEFRQIQATVGWNGRRLAAELGLSPDTVSRLRYGREARNPITGPVVLAMRALASGWRP